MNSDHIRQVDTSEKPFIFMHNRFSHQITRKYTEFIVCKKGRGDIGNFN